MFNKFNFFDKPLVKKYGIPVVFIVGVIVNLVTFKLIGKI